jgi:hypothetical protein
MEIIKLPKKSTLDDIKKAQEHYDGIAGKGKYLVIRDDMSVESYKDKGDLLLG